MSLIRCTFIICLLCSGNMLVDSLVRYPGAKVPEYLEKADLPGTYGFDPLGLGTNPTNLAWYHEAEKTNGRWAMAACAGILFVELTKGSNWVNAGAEVRLLPSSPRPSPKLPRDGRAACNQSYLNVLLFASQCTRTVKWLERA